jgi:hypothetical protein
LLQRSTRLAWIHDDLMVNNTKGGKEATPFKLKVRPEDFFCGFCCVITAKSFAMAFRRSWRLGSAAALSWNLRRVWQSTDDRLQRLLWQSFDAAARRSLQLSNIVRAQRHSWFQPECKLMQCTSLSPCAAVLHSLVFMKLFPTHTRMQQIASTSTRRKPIL